MINIPLYGLIHLRNIKNSEGIKGKGEKNEWEMSEWETEHERLLTRGNKLGVGEEEVGRGWG